MNIPIDTKNGVAYQDAIDQILDCYGTGTWLQETNELFPTCRLGCINFGYWEYVPDTIPLEAREKSQLDLYKNLFDFSGINKALTATILEIGCGRGHGVHLLSENGHNSYGIDLVVSQIQKCMRNYPNLASKFKQGLSNHSGFLSDTFNFVISIEAAQHFYSFFDFAQESYRILKEDGVLAITTFFFTKETSKREIKDLIPPGVIGTHFVIPIDDAKNFLEQAGFRNIKIISIGAFVFHGFCKWAVQSMSKKNHTPKWVEAYEKGFIDYYMISAEKKISC